MGAMILVARRARRDAGLLLTLLALVVFATILAVAIPRLVVDTIDAGAREEVATVGSRADAIVVTAVGKSTPARPAVTADAAISLERDIPGRLPPGLAKVVDSSTLTVLSPELIVKTDLDVDTAAMKLGMLTPGFAEQLRLVRGELPGPVVEGEPIGVVVADGSGLDVGSVLQPNERLGRESITFVVTGIIEPVGAASARPWLDLPSLWRPVMASTRGTTSLDVTVMTSPAGMEASYSLFAEAIRSTIRLGYDPDEFSSGLIDVVTDELGHLAVDAYPIKGNTAGPVAVRSDFKDALSSFEAKARGAVAQMSIMIAGVLGVCLVVVLLLSRLLVLRRAAELALERARGASVLSIGVRAAVESVIVAVVAVAAGLAIIGAPADPIPVVVLGVATLLALPVQAVMLAAGTWSRRRVHADRYERSDAEKRRAAVRIAAEFVVVALAVASLVAIRSRGLLQSRTDGVDPLLAAAPLLLAAALALVVLRVHPIVVRLVARAARRSRGVLGILGAVQAARSLAVLPLLALTLAIGLVVTAGMLVETVRTGQIAASWQRVGADVRVDGPQELDAATRAAAAPGVTAASLQLARGAVEAKVDLTTVIAVTIAVDENYGDVLSLLPDAPKDLGVLDLLTPSSDTAPLPLLVSPELADRLPLGPATIDFGDDLIDAEVVGILPGGPEGYRNDPFIFADLSGVIARSSEALVPDTLLIMGPGAAAAAPDGEVLVRTEWLADRQQQALVVGVQQSMLVAAGAVALLAVLALVAGVQSGSRARGRSLSLLRTLGLRARLGWWLALAELAPVVVASLVGGILAGIVIVLACTPSLGLTVLAGGLASPAPSIAPWVVLAVAGGAVLLLALAVLTEVVAHRRDRLSEVLRVGESA